MTYAIHGLALTVILLTSPSNSLAGTAVSLVGIGHLAGGSAGSDVTALSRDGSTAVGWSRSGAGTEAIRFRNGAMQSLGDFDGGSVNSVALCVSADGNTIGGQGTTSTCSPALLWRAETGLQLAGENGQWWSGQTNCITPDGNHYGVSTGGGGWTTRTGFFGNRYDSSRGGTVSCVSDSGLIWFGWLEYWHSNCNQGTAGTGWIFNRIVVDGVTGCHYFGGGVMYGVPPNCCARDGSGAIWRLSDTVLLWAGGATRSLAGTRNFTPSSANGDLSTLFGSDTTSGSPRASIWSSAAGVQSLESYIEARFGVRPALGGRTLTVCRGMSDNGLVFAGSGTNAAGEQEGWVLRVSYDWNNNGVDDAQEIKEGLISDVNNDGIADCYQSGIDCPGPNIAANPGFEAGNALGDCMSELLLAGASTGPWQVVSGVAERANRSKNCASSGWVADFGAYAIELRSAGSGSGTIRQTIATEPGRRYRVSFWMSANCANGGSVSVRASAGNASKIFTRSCEGTGRQSWLRCEFDFVAGLSNELLEFASENQPTAGPVLDAISVADVTVGCPSDLDGNGQVDTADIGLALLNFGPCE